MMSCSELGNSQYWLDARHSAAKVAPALDGRDLLAAPIAPALVAGGLPAAVVPPVTGASPSRIWARLRRVAAVGRSAKLNLPQFDPNPRSFTCPSCGR